MQISKSPIISGYEPLQKAKLFVPTQLSIPFQWQTKVVDLIHSSPSLIDLIHSSPSLISKQFLYIVEFVLVLNMSEILLAGRQAMLNQLTIT